MPLTFAAWVKWMRRHGAAYQSILDVIDRYKVPSFEDPDTLCHYLQGESALNKASIEEAIRVLIETQHWPRTTAEERFYLVHRLMLGAEVASEWARKLPDLESFAFRNLAGRPPNATDAPRVLRWMLIDVWNASGMLFLECWAESHLEQRGGKWSQHRQ